MTEIMHCSEFDQWIVNNNYQQTAKQLGQIMRQCMQDTSLMQHAQQVLTTIKAHMPDKPGMA